MRNDDKFGKKCGICKFTIKKKEKNLQEKIKKGI